MSLISDALARARREAAVHEAAHLARRALPLVTPPRRRPASRAGVVILAVTALAATGVALAWLAITGSDTPSPVARPGPPASPSVTAATEATPTPALAEAGKQAAASLPAGSPAPTATPHPGVASPAPPAGETARPGGAQTPTPTPTGAPVAAPAHQATTSHSAGPNFLPPTANASAPMHGRPPLPTRPVEPTPNATQTPIPTSPPATATPRPPTAAPTAAPDSRPVRSFLVDADLGHTKLHLDYIVFKPSAPFASINGQRVVVGSTIGQAQVVAILEVEVHIEDRAGRVILRAR